MFQFKMQNAEWKHFFRHPAVAELALAPCFKRTYVKDQGRRPPRRLRPGWNKASRRQCCIFKHNVKWLLKVQRRSPRADSFFPRNTRKDKKRQH